jgi:hypothetical protein
VNDDIPDFLTEDGAERSDRWPLALLGVALIMALATVLL